MGFLELLELKNSKGSWLYWFWSDVTSKNTELHQDIFVNIEPEAILEIDDIDAYNKQEGLALSLEEVEYLDNLAKLNKWKLFAFSQANSEHCRHKILMELCGGWRRKTNFYSN
jgi:CTP:phosphocholine cytidylyltransferase-like protein